MRQSGLFKYGEHRATVTVSLSQHLSLPWLRALAEIAQAGGLGVVQAFAGAGRTPAGRGVRFGWRRGGRLAIGPAKGVRPPGAIRFRGLLDFETVNRLRNFPLFHLCHDAYWLQVNSGGGGPRSEIRS